MSLNVSKYKHNTNTSAGRQFLSVGNLCNQLKNAIAIHGFSYSFMTHVCLEQMSSQVSKNENTLKVRNANLGNVICCCCVHIQETLKAKRGSYPILYRRNSLAGLSSKQWIRFFRLPGSVLGISCLLTAFIAESLFVTAAVLLVKYKVR